MAWINFCLHPGTCNIAHFVWREKCEIRRIVGCAAKLTERLLKGKIDPQNTNNQIIRCSSALSASLIHY